MAANPALVQTPEGLVPAPFPNESFLLKRDGIMLELDGVRTTNGKWNSKGSVFVSNIRLVFIAEKADTSGLTGFDLPLVYIFKDSLVQPIFSCNNLKGELWPAVDGGGPAGSLPPHKFIMYFKEGGIGTFFPLYYTLAERAKRVWSQNEPSGTPRPQQEPGWRDPNPSSFAESLISRAFVDPNDPSTLYLSEQPAPESQRLPDRPKYAANYGHDEVYEDMVPGHGGRPTG
ncbi:hypothetical protein CEUSTIGMA_g10421.t1 [Chlamydomonas eustigma]|uniref:GRAM domain-containing protein n=1 Tax=Chlamydomonas eustigma TaxID=1157962 RepID=A0A250XIT9_9CHLO|nr:hypothetical protein CEUSTIGMA_g10421.t1 [Chlamydomonas eustigma]|eukprot:GAX82994.1 hypothetical protein CEUSTIGMA_g10421.t1 [Chlamydomonas eustigma]